MDRIPASYSKVHTLAPAAVQKKLRLNQFTYNRGTVVNVAEISHSIFDVAVRTHSLFQLVRVEDLDFARAEYCQANKQSKRSHFSSHSLDIQLQI